MVLFCRNCGKDLVGTPEICANCGAKPLKATAFCRFCGNATTAQDLACPTCGAAIKKIAGVVKQAPRHPVLTALNVMAIAVVVSVYIWLALPPKVVKPIKAVASDVVMATTGYTALPLDSISASPPRIPLTDPESQIANFFANDGNVVIVVFAPNDTQQLTIEAIYRNTTTSNTTKATRSEDVTANSTYRSSNDNIATVTSGGLIQGVAVGSATITVSYTAVPGSANLTAASGGKVPITVTVTVPVIVTKLTVYMGEKVP